MGGGVHEGLTSQMERDGIAVPDNVGTQPILQANLVAYLDAFYELDTERAHGQVPGPIPWSRIVEYGSRYGFDIEELVFFIRQMDDAHLHKVRKGNTDGGTPGTRTVVQRPPRPD